MTDYKITLSPDLEINAANFVTAWNDTPNCREVAEAHLKTSAAVDYSHVGWAKSFSCPPSSLKKWWATKRRCPPYMASSLKKWWATKRRCPPYMALEFKQTVLLNQFIVVLSITYMRNLSNDDT
jgi:hypothetical protein